MSKRIEVCPECGSDELWDKECDYCGGIGELDDGCECLECLELGALEEYCECEYCGNIFHVSEIKYKDK